MFLDDALKICVNSFIAETLLRYFVFCDNHLHLKKPPKCISFHHEMSFLKTARMIFKKVLISENFFLMLYLEMKGEKSAGSNSPFRYKQPLDIKYLITD